MNRIVESFTEIQALLYHIRRCKLHRHNKIAYTLDPPTAGAGILIIMPNVQPGLPCDILEKKID